MTIQRAVSIGLTADKLSKQITGSNGTSVSRTAISTSLGAGLGAAAAGTFTVAAGVAGLAAAPITVPLAVASGIGHRRNHTLAVAGPVAAHR